MISSFEVIQAIQARLTGSTDLTNLVPATSIGTYLKQDNSYPHIFYDVSDENLNVKNEDGFIMEVTFSIWSNQPGLEEILNIRDVLYTLFQGSPLSLVTGDNFVTTYLTADPVQASDGETYTLDMLFQLMIGQA